MKHQKTFLIMGSLLLLAVGVGVSFLPLASILGVLGCIDNLIGVGTFAVVLAMAYRTRAEKMVGEEAVKVFLHTTTEPNKKTGEKFPAVTRVCKNGVNFRFTRRELTPIFLLGWLKEAFPELREVDLSFVLTENQEAFRVATGSGTELRLKCENHVVFAKIFSAFHKDVPEDRIREALTEGLEKVEVGPHDSGCSIPCTQRLSTFGGSD